MARPWWSLPAAVALIGAAWVGYLGYDIWSAPQPGRGSSAALVSALDDAVSTRDEAGLQNLFGRDAPDDYAAGVLAQVPDRTAASAVTSTSGTGTVVTLRVGSGVALRCTSWPVRDDGGRFTLDVVPALTAPCAS